MPEYIFRLPGNAAGRSVSIFDNAGGVKGEVVASGVLDADATITRTLDVGDYLAEVRIGYYLFTAVEELASPVDEQSLSTDALRAAFATVVHHGTDGATARPASAYPVTWIGMALPANANKDLDYWIATQVIGIYPATSRYPSPVLYPSAL